MAKLEGIPAESLADWKKDLAKFAIKPELLAASLPELLAKYLGPKITSFEPLAGHPGTMVTLHGKNFSPEREKNQVSIGGRPAFVVSAAPDKLEAICATDVATGPIKIDVEGKTATGPADFTVLAWPSPGSGGDGPPSFFEGAGGGPSAGVDAIGTIKSLVVICRATDTLPTDPADVAADVKAEFDQAITYYDQVSYGRTELQLDYTDWVDVTGEFDDYVDASINNFANPEGINRIVAEAAQGAVDQGLDLDDYTFMAVVLYRESGTIRAWGGWSQSNFSYSGDGLNINLTADHAIGLTTIGHDADWGRFSHELAHSLVDAGAVLGEDIYSSDLIDGSVASASQFDLMGSHDSHPNFSGHFLKQLGYYESSNVVELAWDGNPFSQSYTLVAHGENENTNSGRKHLIEIAVGGGVFYYIEAREKNDGSPLIFDTNIPTGGEAGGLVVTKVFTDQVNMNQEMRFLTLLHDVETQPEGAVIVDPARGLEISVGSVTSTNPLRVEVTVAWAQAIADDPNGDFDLRLSQASKPWISDDIWVDREPWGVTPETEGGKIVSSLEKPRPGEINRFYGQVLNSGPGDATNVKMTFYSISPPGVGDNGAWAPLGTKTVPSVPGGTLEETYVNWTPLVGEHTCLKVFASPQFGEITGSNNQAQENVFYFAAEASSPPKPVKMEFAVRNPLDEDVQIPVHLLDVPRGYVVHMPHRWVEVPAKGERRMSLTVIPYLDVDFYLRGHKEMPRSAPVRIVGFVPHAYREEIDVTKIPAFTHRLIGGVTMHVTPKHKADVRLEPDREHQAKNPDAIAVVGQVKPPLADQCVTVVVQAADGRRKVADVMTDAGGRFRFALDERGMKTDPQAPWEGRETGDTDDIFAVRAELFVAADLAPAKSDPVYFDLRKRKPEPPSKDDPKGFAKPPKDCRDDDVAKATELPASLARAKLTDTPARGKPAKTKVSANGGTKG